MRPGAIAGCAEDTAHLPLHLRVRARLPDALKQRAFLLENWRWIGLRIVDHSTGLGGRPPPVVIR